MLGRKDGQRYSFVPLLFRTIGMRENRNTQPSEPFAPCYDVPTLVPGAQTPAYAAAAGSRAVKADRKAQASRRLSATSPTPKGKLGSRRGSG